MTSSIQVLLLLVPFMTMGFDWDPESPAAQMMRMCPRYASLIECRFGPAPDSSQSWAILKAVSTLSGSSIPINERIFVGSWADIDQDSSYYVMVQALRDPPVKQLHMVPLDTESQPTYYICKHPVMGPYLLKKTNRMHQAITEILANQDMPNLDRAMLWSGFKQESGQNRRFYEVEFAWRFPPYEETNRIIKDSDLPIVTQLVETDGYSKGFHHYMTSFAFTEYRRFEPEWLMEIVRKHLENGMLWPIQQDVIITYGTAQDIDKVATVCVADRPPGAILIGASILAARRPEEARRFIQRQLDSHNVRTEYREVMEEILAKIKTNTQPE